MQEEVENKTVTLIINSTKFSGRVLKSAISKYLAHRSAKRREKSKDVIPHGKQSVKKLLAQNEGVSKIDVGDKDIKGFEKIARKYHVDFAVRKTKGHPPRFLVFFKAKDEDALISAMTEFTQRKEYKKDHPSIVKRLARNLEQQLQKIPEKVRNKRQELDR